VPTVAAIVLAPHRPERLAAVRGQSRPPDRIVEAGETLRDGLLAGLEAQPEAGWLWLVGPGTVPGPAALAELLGALERLGELPPPVLLASRSLRPDGADHPLDAPWPRFGDKHLEVEAAERGLVVLRATACASVLVDRLAAAAAGPPAPAFGPWTADLDFTARLLRSRGVGYLVPASVVEHRDEGAGPEPGRLARDQARMLRGRVWGFQEGGWFAVRSVREAAGHVRSSRHRPRAAAAVLRGVAEGLVRR